ncbi:urotensin 1 [Neosynchiropus ocellatus]
MKGALLLLASLLLLTSHLRLAAGRPRALLGWMDDRFEPRGEPDPLPLLDPEEREGEGEALLRRSEEPPLSIDLTFHLLRNMIQMAKMENQREQAQFNRKVLDEVGK